MIVRGQVVDIATATATLISVDGKEGKGACPDIAVGSVVGSALQGKGTAGGNVKDAMARERAGAGDLGDLGGALGES
jgi:hypothetical protein